MDGGGVKPVRENEAKEAKRGNGTKREGDGERGGGEGGPRG